MLFAALREEKNGSVNIISRKYPIAYVMVLACPRFAVLEEGSF